MKALGILARSQSLPFRGRVEAPTLLLERLGTPAVWTLGSRQRQK